jgi:hypothetical protein
LIPTSDLQLSQIPFTKNAVVSFIVFFHFTRRSLVGLEYYIFKFNRKSLPQLKISRLKQAVEGLSFRLPRERNPGF